MVECVDQTRPLASILWIAPMVVMAACLAGCAKETISDSQPNAGVKRFYSISQRTTPFRVTARRPQRPTFEDRAAPEPAASADASVDVETTASIPEPTKVASAPDPRTARAMNCRDQMFKEYKPVRFGANGNAAAQREFFDSCMKREPKAP